MSDSGSILRLLTVVRRRLRGNRLVQVVVDGAIALLGAWLALRLWSALAPRGLAVGWPGWLVAALVVVAVQAIRMGRGETLSGAARSTDRAADLHDELTSAYWFSRQGQGDDWVGLHVHRAAETAGQLDPERLVPWRRPQRLATVPVLAVALVAIGWLPIPRVFEGIAQRLAQLDLGGGEEPAQEPLAALEELGDRAAQPELSPEQEQEMLLPMMEEAEPGGEDALAEEGGLEEVEEPEGQLAEGDEPGQQGEQGEQSEGEQAETQSPEDAPGESEGEAPPDATASQDEGQGESTDESGPMLPGGDEVFLQEGGEDVEQSQLSEEEMGHATREGGGEEELELGEVSTLDVQLEREILEIPEEEAEPESEDKEELVTKAEQSFLEFEDVVTPDETAMQELLQAESIPWRYRQLVLDYFRALRNRDNQKPQQDRE